MRIQGCCCVIYDRGVRAARYESSLGSQRDSTRLDVMGRVRRVRSIWSCARDARRRRAFVLVCRSWDGRRAPKGREIRVGLVRVGLE